MKLSEMLICEACRLEMHARTKNEALTELADALGGAAPELDRSELLAQLQARERLGTTALGDGIAIPHARLARGGRLRVSFGRSRAGVDFDSIDGNPTHLFFVIVAPEGQGAAHLAALARLSRLLGSESFRRRLDRVEASAELARLLEEEEART